MGRMRQRALKIRKNERSLARHEHDHYESDERGSEYAYDDDQASFLNCVGGPGRSQILKCLSH